MADLCWPQLTVSEWENMTDPEWSNMLVVCASASGTVLDDGVTVLGDLCYCAYVRTPESTPPWQKRQWSDITPGVKIPRVNY
jgi:hypothetical protein